MDTIIYYLLAISYLALLIWGLLLTRKSGFTNIQNVILLVSLGLFYDNLIIALGSTIGEGSLLEGLSYPRYWMHAIFTPLLILFAWSVCNRARITWAQNVKWIIFAWLLTIGFIIYECVSSLIGLELKPQWKNDLLTYEPMDAFENPLMVIVITLLLFLAGIRLLKKDRFPWLLIGTLLMILGSILGIWFKDSPLMNGFELILMVSLLLTKRFQDEMN